MNLSIVAKLRILRNAYRAGLLTDRQAFRWADRLTRHLPYDASDPQDRRAFHFITG